MEEFKIGQKVLGYGEVENKHGEGFEFLFEGKLIQLDSPDEEERYLVENEAGARLWCSRLEAINAD